MSSVSTNIPPPLKTWLDTINCINNQIIVEESRQLRNDKTLVSKIFLRKNDDLVIETDLKLQIVIDFELEGNQLKVQDIRFFLDAETDRRYFPSEILRENSFEQIGQFPTEISLPWFNSTLIASYPLSVWLFGIRSLLKHPRLPSYHCSVLLHPEFRGYGIENSMLVSRNSSSVSGHTHLHFGMARSKGRRNYMEDVEFVYPNIKISEKELVTIFGVLDGHGSADCAQYVAEEIPSKITALLRKRGTREAGGVEEALYQTFREIDLDYLRTCAGSNAGSTACVLFLHHQRNTILIANTGDTRAVLCHNHIAINLSYDRKATDPEEVSRIVRSGGFVKGGRVQGILAVTRAFGDLQLKKVSGYSSESLSSHSGKQFNPDSTEILICDPEISSFSPITQDEFMIVATDGLWDVMTSQQAVDIVLEECSKIGLVLPPSDSMTIDLKSKLDKIANILLSRALELGSTDNITVMIIVISSTQLQRHVTSSIINNTSDYVTASTIQSQISRSTSANTFPLNKHNSTDGFQPRKEAAGISLTERNQQTGNCIIKESRILKEEEDDLMDFLMDDKNFLS